MLSIFMWIVFGLLVGVIARTLMAQRHNSSLPMALLLGAGGGLLGGLISQFVFGYTLSLPDAYNNTFNGKFLLSLISAILGAIILSAAFQIVLNNREG